MRNPTTRTWVLLVTVLGVVGAGCGHTPTTSSLAAASAVAKPLPTGDIPDQPGDVSVAPPAPVISPEQAKAAEKLVDKAVKAERLDKAVEIAGNWLTPAPDAIKASRKADDAEAKVKEAHFHSKDKADDRKFGLYTGGPRKMLPDGSTGPPRFDNTPVWVVTYTGVGYSVGLPSSSSGPELPATHAAGDPLIMPTPEQSGPAREQAMTGTFYVFVDDATGNFIGQTRVGQPVGGLLKSKP